MTAEAAQWTDGKTYGRTDGGMDDEVTKEGTARTYHAMRALPDSDIWEMKDHLPFPPLTLCKALLLCSCFLRSQISVLEHDNLGFLLFAFRPFVGVFVGIIRILVVVVVFLTLCSKINFMKYIT